MISLPEITLEDVLKEHGKQEQFTKQQVLRKMKRNRLARAISEIDDMNDVKLWLTHAMLDDII